MSRRTRWGIAVAAIAVIAVAVVIAALVQRPRPHAVLHLDQRAVRPESPAVSARYAAWTDAGAHGVNGVVLFDSATGTLKVISPSGVQCGEPALTTGTVIYVDHRSDTGDLYSYDIASGTTRPFVVAPGLQTAPSADGDWAVWEDDGSTYGPRIHARRLSGGGEVIVPTAKPGGIQRRPQVAGGFVVWEEYSGGSLGSGAAAIYGYDLVSKQLTPIAAEARIHLLPATDGRYVAWSEQRGTSLAVSVWDRTTGKRAVVPGANGEQTTPAVSRGGVYWVQSAQQRFDVRTWSIGESSTATLPGAPGADQVGIRAAHGSRVWLELRGGRWHVRADFSANAAGDAAQAKASAPPRPLFVRSPAPPAPLGPLLLVQASQVPTAPADPVAAVVAANTVSVTWQPSGGGVLGYDVYRSPAPITSANIGSASKVASVAAPPATFAADPTEVTALYTWYYVVVARDAAGNTARSINTVPDPHGTAAGDTSVCRRCHLNPGAPPPGTRQNCYECHGSTPNTRLYGAAAPFDAQAEFRDDTASLLPPGGSRHRNAFMTDNVRECDACHSPHRKPYDPNPVLAYTDLLRVQLATAPVGTSGYQYNTAAAPIGNQFCFDCHGTDITPITLVGGSTAYFNAGGDHKTGWTASANTHASKVAAPTSDPGIQCEACHDKHGSSAGSLLGRYDAATDTNRINGAAITGNDNSVCLACHSSASAGFPIQTRDASGFPTSGTWPGASVWNTPYDNSAQTGSMHSASTVVWPGTGFAGGDCKNCHRMHGPSNRYAILRDTDAAGVPGAEPYTSTDFRFCLNCHDGSPGFDVARYFPPSVGGSNGGSHAGHLTVDAGTLPAGSPLPCYDCHDPHGSSSAYGLAVQTQTNATTTIVVGDVAGEIVMGPTRTASDVRHFCLTCHTTADTANGWNGSAIVAIASGAKVEGIDRVSTLAVLRLPSVNGHNAADTQPCYQCHGSDYSSASSANVHNPGGGVSAGSVACYGCHMALQSPMDVTGATRTSWYHHVLGSATASGDMAPGSGTYPSTVNPAAQEVYCVSCHTDHNYFSADHGSNLRQGIGLAGSATTNTDFASTAPYGICVSCHSVSMTRDNVNQKSAAASSRTPTIPGPDFAASAHQYAVAGAFGTAGFKANCTKCHDDEQSTSFQTGTYKFSLHYSAESRLLAAMGTTIPASGLTMEALCYRCHSGSGTSDFYGASTMTTNSKSLLTEFSATYKHPIATTSSLHRSDENLPTAARHVACEDCHNPHAARKGTHTQGSSAAGPALFGASGVVPAFGASNFSTPTGFAATRLAGAATDYEAYVCFKCHTSYVSIPTTGGSGGFGGTNLAVDYNPNNQSGHSVLGASTTWPKTVFGSFTWSWPTTSTTFNTAYISTLGQNYKMTCSDCHSYDGAGARGPHGSASKFILIAGGTADWYTTTLGGWSTNFLCGKCHLQGSNNVHTRSNHSSYTCERCHIRIPHGWKRPRFLERFGTDPAPYVTTQSSSLAAISNASHTPTGWSQSNCQSACYNGHGTVSSPWP